MNQDQEYIRAYESSLKEDEFDFKKWLIRIIKMWPWFLVSIALCLGLAYVYLLYAHPVYDAMASIMVKDEKKGAEMMDNSVLKEMGLGGNSKLVENETEVLKSPDLMEAVVKKLKLYISANEIGRIKNASVFENQIPFIVEVINPQDLEGIKDIEWIIRKTGTGFLFKNKFAKDFQILEYGKLYKSGRIYFRCLDNPFFYTDDGTKNRNANSSAYDLMLTPLNDVIINYGKRLTIEQPTKLATVITLGIKDENEIRAIAILRSLIDIYNQEGLEDKNRVTDSTINFLDERLIAVANGLQIVEGTVEKFKTENRVTDIPTDVQQYMTLAQQVDVQKAQSETQLNIVNALEDELEKNQDNPQLVPSTLGIGEPTLAMLVEKHNELLLQKERILQKSGPQNPLLIDLQDQIKEVRMKLLANVRNLKQAYHISLNDVSKKDAHLSRQIQNVPALEKKLIQITRNKEVQQQIYAFLLQKREEAAVTRASNVDDSRTITRPRGIGRKWPVDIIVWGIGFLLGLLLPVAIIYLRDFMNNKVGDTAQIAQFIDLPMLGVISHIKKIRSPVVISSSSRSVAAEQIRSIRTAISFTGKGKTIKTVLATSFQPGDGKSFVSMNLAAGYALLGKKTVILEFDLRKPHIAKYLELENKEGISSILSGKSSVDQLLVEVPGFDGNLFMLPAGYLPPNPAELISGPRMGCLIKELEERFDYIIIDTPPFGIVADATLLQQYADISLVVLRQDHTSREVYTELRQHVSRYPGRSVYLLLNDVGKSKRYQNGYAYGKEYYSDK